MTQDLLNRAFWAACGHGQIAAVKRLMEAGADPTPQQGLGMLLAADKGQRAIAEIILHAQSPSVMAEALDQAIQKRQTHLYALMLPHASVRQLSRKLFNAQRWSDLDEIGPFVPATTRQRWLQRTPTGALPQTEASLRARQREQRLARLAPTPGRGRLRS